MLHALAHGPDGPDANSQKTAQGGGDLTGPMAVAGHSKGRRTAQTPRPDGLGEPSPTVDAEAPAAAQDLPETKLTSAFKALEKAEPDSGKAPRARRPSQSPAAEQKRKPSGHFTAIGEEELDRIECQEPSQSPLIAAQTLGLVIALFAVVGTVWYLLRPPSADALYERITAVADDQTESSLREVEDDIKKFLASYSDDPRCQEVQQYRREIELARLERSFERRASGQIDTESLLPVERMCVEAINVGRVDPERGMAKLRVMIDLYQDQVNDSGPTGQCLQLAQRLLDRLSEQVKKSRADGLAMLDERLDAADQLSRGPAGQRQMAAKIRRAVIKHYQDEPWASEAVRRAQQALATEDEAPSSTDSRQGALD
jgi:hypothetical protein